MQKKSAYRRNLLGFTLIELMITLSIVVIVSLFAIPSFNGAIASSRLTSSTNEIYTALVQAKSEAVRRGKRVTVCATADGATCSDDGSGWSTGWITFVDSTRTTVVSQDPGESVIAVGQAVNTNLLIQGPSYFSFSADSRSRDMSGGFLVANLRVCSTSSALDNNKRSRMISTGVSGRLNVLPDLGVSSSCPAP